MGLLLAKAIEQASKLPEKEQEAIGAWLLAELAADRAWDELFEGPGAAVRRLADEALRDHEHGRTEALDPARM